MRLALCSDEKYPVHDTIRRVLEDRGHEVVPFGAVRTPRCPAVLWWPGS